jgi:S-adenosylmethionine hydrolase
MITLLTDFGHKDAYVGVMKGVIYAISEDILVTDLCHEILPQNILHAQVLLYDNFRYFPENTIFCCVIDPGVGSSRPAIVVEWGDYWFVGPDNGLFTFAILGEDAKVYEIPGPIPEISSTFHGRDVFAPFCARLEKDMRIYKELKPIENGQCQMLEIPEPKSTPDGLKARILYEDHFGNIITNLRQEHLSKEPKIKLSWNQIKFATCYSELEPNQPGCLIGSSGRLEICLQNGSAADFFRGKSIEIIAS